MESLNTLRQNAIKVVDDARNYYVSPYEEWTTDELRDLLVEYKIPIRDSANASHETLVRLCDKTFGEEAAAIEKESRQHYTIEQVVRMDSAARMIQRAFFRRKQAMKKRHAFNYHEVDGMPAYLETFEGDDGIEAGNNYNRLRKLSMLKQICAEKDDRYDDEIHVEWRKPSIAFAKKYAALNHPHRPGKQMTRYVWTSATLGRHCWVSECGEQFDLWNEGRTSEFSQFGSGITNYFKFLKWSTWVLLLLSIIHLPVLILNTFGVEGRKSFSSAIKDQTLVAMTTFGNLGSTNVTAVTIPGCDNNEFQFEYCEIDKNTLAKLYAYIDIAGTVVFVIAWFWLRRFEAKESSVLKKSTVTANDFTIRITNVPGCTTEKELAVHFVNITGKAVAAVHLALNNAKEINAYIQRGKVVEKRYHCVQRIRHAMTTMSDTPKRRKLLRKLMCERDELTILVRQQDERRSKVVNYVAVPIEAFVTFETEAGFVDAMSQYDLNWFRRNCCCYPERLKYRGIKLKVDQAPEASTIIWQNLEFSNKGRFFRQLLTTVVALAAILISVLTTFMARDYKSKALVSAALTCPADFFDQNSEIQLGLVRSNMKLAHCYCSTLGILQQYNINQCRDHLATVSKAAATSYGAGFIVVLINYFFTWLMDRAGEFEKHRSLDEMESSNQVRLFGLKIINTGFLVLLYGQQWLQRLVGVRFEDEATDFNVAWYKTGGTSLITVMAINTIVPHVGSFIAYISHRNKLRRLESTLSDDDKMLKGSQQIYSQEELNEHFKGPPFLLNDRYTQIMVTIYVCWTYAISMPILPIFGMLTCYISYWVDKFMFCNFYCTPPQYSDTMGKASTWWLGLPLLLLHLGMSLWMMSCEEIFQGETPGHEYAEIASSYGGERSSNLREKLNKKHLLPLEAALFIVVAWTLLSNVSSTIANKIWGFISCLMCMTRGKATSHKKEMNTVQISYTSARDRGLIKGLNSYNILENPIYMEAFAITPEFAHSHSRVSSIHGYNTKEDNMHLI